MTDIEIGATRPLGSVGRDVFTAVQAAYLRGETAQLLMGGQVAAIIAPVPAAPEPPADGPRYIAHFTPEVWVRGNAVEVDPLGPQEWDVTAFAAEELGSQGQHRLIYLDWLHRCAQTNGEPDLDSDEGVLDNDDVFRDDPGAPDWVRMHPGPFTIRVHREENYLPGTLVREGHPGDVNDPERYPEG